jgi:microcin C transport system substrate-binding protein
MRMLVPMLILAGLLTPAAAQVPSPTAASPTPASPATAAVPARPDDAAADVTRTYAVSLLGKPALPAGFPYFPYVDTKAPKGGEVALSVVGTFDNFNQFIVQGTAAADIGRIYDTLLVPSANEAGSGYGLLAKTIELPADHSWVAYDLNPAAHFNDGTPVTAEDVAWTFNTLRDKGRPFYKQYYADVKDVTVDGTLRVVFHFRSRDNRELPVILGEMPVLPEHWWKGRDFSKPLTDPPLGSGPYRIGQFEFGRTIAYQRVPDWWAAKLPPGIGRFNFDTMRTEYFRDATVALEAFKSGSIDFRQENIAKQWATAYDFPAVQQGLVKKSEIRHHLPTGMQGFAMNTRRAIFKDPRVRKALAWAYDFQWANKNLFYSAYTRTESYFSNSDLASSGIPQGDELALLGQYRDKLPPALFTEPFRLPVTDGSGNNRPELKVALALLESAGWTVKDLKLVDPQGRQMSFEITLDEPAFERVALPYVQSLARLGIDAHVRTVDPAQYQELMDHYDYDMTVAVFGESDTPGNEQVGYWTCGSAQQIGGDNEMGICDPVVDALVKQLINAPDRARLVTVTHALDRVLLWGWYMVPQWHLDSFRVAYWNRFGQPGIPIRNGLAFDTWWVDPHLAAATDAARKRSP